MNDVISTYEERAANKTLFIETFQRIDERTSLFRRAKERKEQRPLATEEEYQMGIYSEQLESQVREAVLNLFLKGYKTFESGFVESDLRSQYVGMYNLTVEIPYSVSEALGELGFTVESKKMEDRTKIFIRPTKDEPVRLEEWKNVWNTFADLMPVPNNEDLSGSKIYNQHSEFRQRQDKLKDISN
ncbi:MAG: hypothetical protein K9M11_04865 [Candidatus Pacebacteria bacterium]|nr:hypothetical protein [Candidatus Paceibacterota bacterium]